MRPSLIAAIDEIHERVLVLDRSGFGTSQIFPRPATDLNLQQTWSRRAFELLKARPQFRFCSSPGHSFVPSSASDA